ncbi:MAG: GNAT family N-acetyltransferase [Chloroflexota bacterium]
MNLKTYTDATLFDDLEPTWNELVGRSIKNTPFNTWEWNSAWWAAYHPGDLHVVTVTAEDGTLLGIGPWFIENGDDGRILRLIGHVDVTDYMDLIVDAGQRDAVYRCFADYLKNNTGAFDSIGLANIMQDSPTYTEFPDILREVGFTVDFEENDVAPLIHLPDSYDAYLSDSLDSKQRKEIKRKMRKAEGGLYDIQWYIVTAEHDLKTESDRFLQLMESADTEKAEFLQNAQHVDFFNRIVPVASALGWLQLMFITIDGDACAAYLNFDYGNRIYVYNSGLDPNIGGALGPGIILLQYAIQHSIDADRDTFDFLRGNEQYKYRMGGTDTHIYQLNATL